MREREGGSEKIMWITLHGAINGEYKECYVQTENISVIFPSEDTGKQATRIEFSGEAGDYLIVKETTKEIKDKIGYYERPQTYIKF